MRATETRSTSGLIRRLKRWWGQDRIRLSAAEHNPPTPRAGDRLQIGDRGFRLSRAIGGGEHRFEADDEDREQRLTIEFLGTCYRFEAPDCEPFEVPREAVLLYPVSWA